MTEQGSKSPTRAIRKVALAGLVAVPVVAFFVWFLSCPCDRTPGFILLGAEAEAPIADWSFANDVTLCQIQINAGLLAHSINLNCMSTSNGDLYLSCSQCASKRWSNAVLRNSVAKLRLNETVYPVTVTRELDPAALDRAWSARLAKLQNVSSDINSAAPLDTPRPDGWWSFHVVSR